MTEARAALWRTLGFRSKADFAKYASTIGRWRRFRLHVMRQRGPSWLSDEDDLVDGDVFQRYMARLDRARNRGARRSDGRR